jgi:hypothetical protein
MLRTKTSPPAFRSLTLSVANQYSDVESGVTGSDKNVPFGSQADLASRRCDVRSSPSGGVLVVN